MSTQLIELKDGLLVEVEAPPNETPKQIAAGAAERVEGAMDAARDLLLKAVQPVAAIWDELNRDLTIEQVEIETLATEIQTGVQHRNGPPLR